MQSKDSIEIGRLLRSGTTGFVAGCNVSQLDAPVFGGLVRAPLGKGYQVYGLIYDIHIDDDGIVRQLVTADSVDTAEIPVQLSPKTFAGLLPKTDRPINVREFDMETIRKAIGISAIVRLPALREGNDWEARFSRTSESFDLSTGAITVYVVVDDPYEKAVIGKRPPLVKNMYCEVELRGRPIPGRIVIPRSAVHEGAVYLVNKAGRLEKRAVAVESVQGDMAVISGGIEENDPVVVTDVVPAIEGILLKPSEDAALVESLRKKASGEVAFK